MANADFSTVIAKYTHPCTFHIQDLADPYEGADDENFSAADLTTAKGNAISDINTRIDTEATTIATQKTDLSTTQDALVDAIAYPASEADFNTAMATLKADLASAVSSGVSFDAAAVKTAIAGFINAEISDTITVSKKDVMEAVKADYLAAVTIAYPDPCPKCREGSASLGRYAESRDVAGGSNTKLIVCTTCNGFTQVADITEVAPPPTEINWGAFDTSTYEA